jgi:hypothetical protein
MTQEQCESIPACFRALRQLDYRCVVATGDMHLALHKGSVKRIAKVKKYDWARPRSRKELRRWKHQQLDANGWSIAFAQACKPPITDLPVLNDLLAAEASLPLNALTTHQACVDACWNRIQEWTDDTAWSEQVRIHPLLDAGDSRRNGVRILDVEPVETRQLFVHAWLMPPIAVHLIPDLAQLVCDYCDADTTLGKPDEVAFPLAMPGAWNATQLVWSLLNDTTGEPLTGEPIVLDSWGVVDSAERHDQLPWRRSKAWHRRAQTELTPQVECNGERLNVSQIKLLASIVRHCNESHHNHNDASTFCLSSPDTCIPLLIVTCAFATAGYTPSSFSCTGSYNVDAVRNLRLYKLTRLRRKQQKDRHSIVE